MTRQCRPVGAFAIEWRTLTVGLRRPAKRYRRFAAFRDQRSRRYGNVKPNPQHYASAALAWATMASKAAGSEIAISDSILRSSSILALLRPLMNSL